MKRGFTLVELLVVIGIIGILAGIFLASFSGGSESARAAKCLSNMRSLTQACIARATADTTWKHFPAAGSHEYMDVDESDRSNPKVVYNEHKGWISWNSQGAYGKATAHQASGSWMTSMYSQDIEANQYCLTNGAIWKYIGGNAKSFVCPSHTIAKSTGKKMAPVWSYLMNSVFGWDYSQGSKAIGEQRQKFGELAINGKTVSADKVLMFSEVPFKGIGSWQPDGSGSGTDCDCVLQFNGTLAGLKSSKYSGRETIGVNHLNGKNLHAHVAFADGHVEKLRIPFTGTKKAPQIDDGQLRELTAWLCCGLDISFDGSRYQKLEY